MAAFPVGNRVVRNPATWRPNHFDSWGRGVGVGVVVEPPFTLGPDEADVRWPSGRCFEWAVQLLPAPAALDSEQIAERGSACFTGSGGPKLADANRGDELHPSTEEGTGVAEAVRLLEWYAADGSLAGEVAMPTARLDELQALYGVPSSDPMFDCWPVGPAQAVRVAELAGVSVDLARFAYFVTAHAADE